MFHDPYFWWIHNLRQRIKFLFSNLILWHESVIFFISLRKVGICYSLKNWTLIIFLNCENNFSKSHSCRCEPSVAALSITMAVLFHQWKITNDLNVSHSVWQKCQSSKKLPRWLSEARGCLHLTIHVFFINYLDCILIWLSQQQKIDFPEYVESICKNSPAKPNFGEICNNVDGYNMSYQPYSNSETIMNSPHL